MKVNPEKLTHIEIEIIHQEYQKEKQGVEPNWEKIDSIILRLKFFSKYIKHVRLSLIKSAKFFMYKPGDIVFREGDIGDLFYIILKGSVNIRNRMKNPEGNEEDLLTGSIYEGNSFGDIDLTETKKNKELANIDWLAQKKTYHDIKKDFILANNPPPKTLINETQSYIQSNIGDHRQITQNAGEETNESTKVIHKRTSTIEVVESLCCLLIPRENIQRVLVSLIQKELDQKVKALMSLSFFAVMLIFLWELNYLRD